MKGIVATDLDGTLFNSTNVISQIDLSMLSKLKELGYVRVIATGRSLFSIEKAIPTNTPIDYIVFSSGAGIYDWRKKEVIFSKNLSSREVEMAFKLLVNYNVDFTIQDKIPYNHCFVFIRNEVPNPDFERRNNLYTEFSKEITPEEFIPQESCQLLAITENNKGIKIVEELSFSLKELKIIRSTSPIDHQSVWIEIFSKKVSKASGVSYLAKMLNIKPTDVMAIGNDYNDLDLLNWAGKAYVVSNAPEEVKRDYCAVSSNDHSGFNKAVRLWLKSRE